MNLKLLGPLELIVDRRSLDIGGARQRTILATLALNANRITTVEQLVDAVWDTSPPETARGQIQTCISSLRKLFTSAGRPEAIDTHPHGYQLRLGAAELDSEEFGELVAAARGQVAEGQLAQAATTLRKALGLWRGVALADVRSRQVARDSALLEDRRLSVLEERIRLDLTLGRHKEIVEEITALVHEHPLRERLHGFLMLALYRSGRQAEALEVRRRVRTVLVQELGIEPGRELQELEQAILNRDMSLDWRPGGAGEPAAGPSPVSEQRPAATLPMVPHEVPFSIADFTGREALLESIKNGLTANRGDATKYSVSILAISGKGGVGKSSLAVRVAHELINDFPDGHLFGDFRASAGRSATVLARFLRAMGVSGSAIPEDLEERARMFRSAVARRRMLVVLDDVTSEDQVLPLLPGSPNCAVLITSRTRLSGLPGASWIDVEPFDITNSVELLRKIVGPARVDAEPAATVQLVRFCGGLPLALRIAGARLASRPHWLISQLVRRLGNEAGRLDEFSHRGLEVRATITSSYRALAPRAQRLFRLLAAVDSPDSPGWIAAALLDCSLAEADEVLHDLVDARMLDTVEYSGERIRYRLHDLLRVYALEQLACAETAGERDAAVRRVLGAWLGLAEEAHRHEYGGDYTILHGDARRWRPPSDDATGTVDSWYPGRDWLDVERGALVLAIRQAAAADLDDLCWDLALTSVTLFETKGYFDLWRETTELALAVTERMDNRTGRAAMLYSLGNLHMFQKRLTEAEKHLAEALEIFEEDDNTHGRGLVLRNIALVHGLRGDTAAMLATYAVALHLLRDAGDRMAEAQVLRSLAKYWIDEGDAGAGLPLLEEARAICREVRCLRGEAQVEHQFAYLYLSTGEVDRSMESMHRVLLIVRDIGDRIGEAYALYGMGVVRHRQGRAGAAERTLLHALALALRVGERLVQGQVLYALGEIAFDSGDMGLAASHLATAGQLFEELGSVLWQAKTLSLLSDLHTVNREPERAAVKRGLAVELLENLDSKEAARWLAQIGERDTSGLGTGATELG
jgi:DNA-binding SARP family transcriptional activator/tetratricopeptide (TPR) repeat protein